MRSKQSRLIQRTSRITPIRPGEPREPMFDSETNVLSWKGPADDAMVTHYRIRSGVETAVPLFQVPVGQKSVQVGPGLGRVFITAYNHISGLESGHIEHRFVTTPEAPFSDLSMLYELPAKPALRVPFHRTIDIHNSAVGNGIADATTVYGATVGASSKALRVVGVLRAAIAADLTVRIKVWIAGVASTVGTFTIPSSTAINTAVSFSTFTTSVFPDLSVLTWDITASDGSVSNSGVASFTLWWR